MIRELIVKNRSYRRFYENIAMNHEGLCELVDLARLSGSAANRQSLRYILSCDAEKNSLIFSNLAWAAALKEWSGPSPGERPAAYIIILDDKEISISYECDYGIAAQSILLGATEKGFGGCMIASIRRESLRNVLKIPDKYDIKLVIALGKPKEKVMIEPVGPSGDVTYWRDSNLVHHVPKRDLKDIILNL